MGKDGCGEAEASILPRRMYQPQQFVKWSFSQFFTVQNDRLKQRISVIPSRVEPFFPDCCCNIAGYNSYRAPTFRLI